MFIEFGVYILPQSQPNTIVFYLVVSSPQGEAMFSHRILSCTQTAQLNNKTQAHEVGFATLVRTGTF